MPYYIIAKGGDLTLEAGDAHYDGHWNQMSDMVGGNVRINAGSSDGHSDSDVGGIMSLAGGNANRGQGGSVDVSSGGSNYASSKFGIEKLLKWLAAA